jgi:hypothetical protein
MLAFINGLCRILQSSSFPSLRDVWSFSATAATDLWESRVGQSAIASEFKGYLGNDAFVTEISFSETRIKSQAVKHAGKEAREQNYIFSGQRLGLLLLVNEKPRHKIR